MNLSKILWRTVLLSAIGFTSTAEAKPDPILGSYKSNGFTIDIDETGTYYGCDPRNRCLRIPRRKSSRQGKAHIWKNAGYIYRVTPVGDKLINGHNTRILVKIINPQQKVIFKRIFRSQ
jgi:hypothetical protein